MKFLARLFGRSTAEPHASIPAEIELPQEPETVETEKEALRHRVLPYTLLRLGPSEKPCPLHSQFEGLLLEQDHSFWGHFKLGKGGHEHCKCWTQNIPVRKREEYVKNGVPSKGKPILDENGRFTGRHEKKTVPAITEI